MVRPAFDSPYDDSGAPIQSGPQYDASHFGGVGNKVQWVDDGTGTGNTKPVIVGTGREDEVNRYRGMGEAAANRGAYQIDYTTAEQDYARQLQARQEQMAASEQMRQAALGNAPSRSEILSRGAMANTFEQQLQNQGAARGIAGNAFAQQQAAQQARTQSLTAMGQFGAGRAGELDAAMGGYARGANAIRGGDYAAQAQHQQQAAAQMAAELRQRQLNQQAQMAYEKMAFGVNKAEMDADIAKRQQYAQRDAMKSQAEAVRKDSEQQVIGATAGGAGTIGAAGLSAPSSNPDPDKINSDDRTKSNVRPLADRVSDRFADAAGSAYAGITDRVLGQSDRSLEQHHGGGMAANAARRLTMTSDDRAKLAAAEANAYALGRAHGDESVRTGRPVPFSYAMPKEDIRDQSAGQIRAGQAARATSAAKPSALRRADESTMASRAGNRALDEYEGFGHDAYNMLTHPREYFANYGNTGGADKAIAAKEAPRRLESGSEDGRAGIAAHIGARARQLRGGGSETPLSPEEEKAFQSWKSRFAPNDSGADYDLRGAFKAGLTPDPKSGHWPDRFKRPNHETFSDESQYAVGPDAARAGHWDGERFVPSQSQNRAASGNGRMDMGEALAQGASPIAFQYKPEFRGEQAPGEPNVGVRAQAMAQNPITGSAVVQQPNGMLGLDVKKATGLNLAAAGYLAQKQREQEQRLRRLEGGK